MALTLRAAFKYTTGAWHGMQLRSELEVVGPIGGDTYNSTQNDKTQYPAIADPAGGHFNRLFLFHKGELQWRPVRQQLLPERWLRFRFREDLCLLVFL